MTFKMAFTTSNPKPTTAASQTAAPQTWMNPSLSVMAVLAVIEKNRTSPCTDATMNLLLLVAANEVSDSLER